MGRIILDRTQFLRGIASGNYSADGFFAPDYMNGIDLFRSKSKYGLIQQGYALTDLTGTVIKDTIKWFVQKGSDVYGYGDDGHLYKFTAASTPVWTPSELDSANYASRAGGRGLAVYNDGTSEKLHYFSNTSIGLYDFNATYNDSYKTGLENAPHPAKEYQGTLYIGNGHYLASLFGTTLNLQALTLPVGYEIQDIEAYNGYLAILAYKTIGTFITECKLFMWDTYTKNSAGDPATNFEYLCPETATALEIYRNDLAVFGNTLRLFSNGAFPVIREFYSGGVTPGGTFYKNNMLYYQEAGQIFSYGTRTHQINAFSQALLYNAGSYGAIIGVSRSANQFLVSNSSDKAGAFISGYSGGFIQSVNIPLPVFAKIRRISFVMEKLAIHDGISGFIYNDDDTVLLTLADSDDNKALSFANYGAITNKSYQLSFNGITNYIYIYLDWSIFSTGNLTIKKIVIDYDPTEANE